MHFRQITLADIPALFAVRTATAENRLSSKDLEVAGITPESVRALLSANHQGWLCEVDGKVVGFCMGDGESGELWVIALLPEFEGRGIGGQLLGKVETWLWSMGHSSLWLWTDIDKTRRAYGFYIRHGWVPDEIAGDDLRMVKFRTPLDLAGRNNQHSGVKTPSDSRGNRPYQVCVLGSAEPGSRAYELAAAAGELLAKLNITVVSGCGSPATRIAAERALAAGGQVVSIVPSDDIKLADWPCTVLIPCGMGDARNLLMALAGDACLVIGGRAGTISEVCLAWLHHRPLLPLTGCGGWSDQLEQNPPDERKNSPILPWDSLAALEDALRKLGITA